MSESKIARIIQQAANLGIDPNAECTDAGMTIVLTKADNLGLTVFKAGMAEDWLDSMRLFCHERRIPPMSFTNVAAAVLQLSVTAENAFIRPKQLWTAVDDYQRRQIAHALDGRATPEIPDEIAGDVRRELDYRRAWNRFAAITGDGQQTTLAARHALGLPKEIKKITPAPMPDELKTQLEEAFKEQK